MQLLTGHGKIKEKLHKLGISDNDICSCGQGDTIKHIIFHCPNHDEERKALREKVTRANIQWPCTLPELTRKNTYPLLHTFAAMAMRSRETRKKCAMTGNTGCYGTRRQTLTERSASPYETELRASDLASSGLPLVTFRR
ncbi:uncharacterized protein LOC143151404 [Ptiloglossa arizonensis]|uniref:uncharacterized protein LOC143151404 n=1 Tax=Ptiloglossa arizonensis TaxID=3350558 RepID=UPI003FA0896F